MPGLVVEMLVPATSGEQVADVFDFLARYYDSRFSRTRLLLRGAVIPLTVFFFAVIVTFVALEHAHADDHADRQPVGKRLKMEALTLMRKGKQQHGFMFADVLIALAVVAILATALTVGITRQGRASKQLADERAAMRLADATVLSLQTGLPAPLCRRI